MLQWAFSCVWNWDARPFPVFPSDSGAMGRHRQLAGGRLERAGRRPRPARAASADPAAKPGDLFDLPGDIDSRMVGARQAEILDAGRRACVRPLDPRDAAGFRLYDIELTYEVLRSDAAYPELQTIAGFFAKMSGEATPFWIAPPGLSAVLGQALGGGDGVTTTFPLLRSVGAYSEPVQGTSGVTAVYLNGVAQSSGWTVSSGYAPAITFAAAPAPGVPVTADFGLLWLCRFAEDVQDLEEFMAMLWTLKTLRLTTVRP